MATSQFPGNPITIQTATAGALTGDGTSGSKLAVAVDGASISVNGSNQLAVVGTAVPSPGLDTQVLFNDGGVDGADAGLTYNKTTNALTPLVLYAGGIIDDDTSGSFQVLAAYDAPTSAGYQAGYGFKSTITTVGDTTRPFATGYFDAFMVFNHNSTRNILGHDFTNQITVAAGKTVAAYSAEYFASVFSGPGTVTESSTTYFDYVVDATQITNGTAARYFAPDISNGGAIGTFYYLTADDLTSTTVGTAKGFINYGAGKFLVDSAGVVTAAGYKSSDGSAGATTTITTASLVGKTITVKNGLITGFA